MRKNCISAVIAVVISLTSYAQSVSGQISLFPVVIEDGLTQESVKNLKNKIGNITAKNGYGSIDYIDRFIISVSTDLVGNSVAPTNPPRVSKQISLTFIIGDILENKSFASTSFTVNGLGTTDNKALIAAFNRISPDQPEIKEMLNEANSKIIEYYGSNTSRFLSNAKAIVLRGQYDEAIAYLMSIPPVNDQCNKQCQDYAIQLYKEKIDNEGYSHFSAAKAEWLSNKTSDGAYKASRHLKNINPSAKSFEEAMKLWDEIENKLDEEEKAAKAFAAKQYNDNLEMKKTQMVNNQAFKMAIVDACKRIGVAYGEHRQQNVTKIVRGWYPW